MGKRILTKGSTNLFRSDCQRQQPNCGFSECYPNFDPNALIMSLTMQDGSIWQQGKAPGCG